MSANTAPFLEGQNIEGISLVTDWNIIKPLKVKLGNFNHGPHNTLPVSRLYSLNMSSIDLIAKEQYFVMPKPSGLRHLLYVDPDDTMYLVNETTHIFTVDRECHSMQIPSDTVLEGIVA